MKERLDMLANVKCPCGSLVCANCQREGRGAWGNKQP